MSPIISIRKYLRGDWPHILKLLIELQDHIALLDEWKLLKPEGDFDADTYLTETFRLVKNNEGRIFVALSENKVVGFIIGIISKPTKIDSAEYYSCKRGTIIELIVHSAFRKKGIGAVLMNSIEAYFHSKNCDIADVKCFAPNRLAYGFYRKSGYTDRSLFLAKKLV